MKKLIRKIQEGLPEKVWNLLNMRELKKVFYP